MTTAAFDQQATMTEEELYENSHAILKGFLEQRGWDVLDPHGWHECHCVAYDTEDDAVVLVNLEAEFLPEDEGQMPPLNIDEIELERAKSLVHIYIGEHPDATSVRFDFVSMYLFGKQHGRIRHLIGGYLWEE